MSFRLNEKFEVDVHKRILNQVVQTLHKRSVAHKKLYADLSYFDPKRFSETVLHGILISAVNMIFNVLPEKSSDSPVQQGLRQELFDFASKWLELKKISPEHCTELDEAGDHFFDFIIDKLQINVLTFYLTV